MTTPHNRTSLQDSLDAAAREELARIARREKALRDAGLDTAEQRAAYARGPADPTALEVTTAVAHAAHDAKQARIDAARARTASRLGLTPAEFSLWERTGQAPKRYDQTGQLLEQPAM